MKDVSNGIAAKVRGVAAECGFTQQRIADTLGISRTAVVDRFNRRVAWSAPEVFVLSQAMSQPLSRFFPEPASERIAS